MDIGGTTVKIGLFKPMGKLLGKGLAAIACVVNPEAFVIGGAISGGVRMLLQ